MGGPISQRQHRGRHRRRHHAHRRPHPPAAPVLPYVRPFHHAPMVPKHEALGGWEQKADDPTEHFGRVEILHREKFGIAGPMGLLL